jgi:hypothetical protein
MPNASAAESSRSAFGSAATAHGTADQGHAAACFLRALPSCSSLQELSEHVWTGQEAFQDYLNSRYSNIDALRNLADSEVLELLLAGLAHGLQLLAAEGTAAVLPDHEAEALTILADLPAQIIEQAVTWLKEEGAAKAVDLMENSSESACAATTQAAPMLRSS